MMVTQTTLRKSDKKYLEEWILGLLLDNPQLQDITWLDKVGYAMGESNPPVGTVFKLDQDYQIHSIGGADNTKEDYEYTLSFKLELINTRSDNDADWLSWIEEKIEETFVQVCEADAATRRIKDAAKEGKWSGTPAELLEKAVSSGAISEDEKDAIIQAKRARFSVNTVDAFDKEGHRR